MNSATHLAEHCRTCDGLGYVGRGLVPCAMCTSGRRVRGTHDAESAIDAEPPAFGFSPFYASLPLQRRLVELVRAHPNDAELGAALRELVGVVDG